MARDTRPRSDWSRQFDSVFKPRTGLPGSRRGRVLLVFSAFLIVEAAFVIQLLEQGHRSIVGFVLWGIWAAVCLAWVFLPQLNAEDAPGHQRMARQVGLAALGIGLVITLASLVAPLSLPAWWPLAAGSGAVAAVAGVLGVLEWRQA